ncbi:gluconate 2-dehydrogenase subunit 3 family protein [Polaribacter batillariae]|uniref:Gluconate 2-dehydrogenase subunit 3 family protein n=1 Tax=Polaribacter batillariae TaxID=2808900 RepID=A0ABX7SPT9_9FLAO|nr:gluconate 2-dehydrogenase subunit 3 family protein [Polaribacter batillariae]QTD36232.1 gluconate 2-dehydrogenase subunit 3 family protein [Polaribacter batillariae]
MKRRESLKILTFGLGGVVAAPVLLQLLSSCKTDRTVQWAPQFLTEEGVFVVSHLADLILPASKTMGALDVKVPQFIDLVLEKVATKAAQEKFNKGAILFKKSFEKTFTKEISEGTKSNFLTLLNTYFKISSNRQVQIFKLLESNQVSNENKETCFIYSYLMFVRHYTLFGYYTSEEVGKEILTYNPTPGFYNGCVPVEEAGNIQSA